MRDLITSGVKTAVQAAVSFGVTWLINFGVVIDPDAAATIQTGAFLLVMAIVTGALNALGKKFPIVNKIVSLGLSESTASY